MSFSFSPYSISEILPLNEALEISVHVAVGSLSASAGSVTFAFKSLPFLKPTNKMELSVPKGDTVKVLI